jgi:hypothetical protein
MFELKLSQELDRGAEEIPDATRIPYTVEGHSHNHFDRIEGWRMRNSHKMLWLVVWRDKPIAVFFKREWAREFIRELKVAWIHEQ